MTREEIDAMCIEAVRDADRDGVPHIRYHFAARVAAAEREACAQVCESLIASEYATGKVDHNERAWTELCASKIRARGK